MIFVNKERSLTIKKVFKSDLFHRKIFVNKKRSLTIKNIFTEIFFLRTKKIFIF